MDNPTTARFVKPTRSGDDGNCVEVADVGLHRLVRDSKNPTGPVLAVPAGQFAALLDGIKTGQL